MSKARVVAFVNQKGGSAKTTTCAAFADELKRLGFRVLCVDMDPQDGNLSLVMGADRDGVAGSAELIHDACEREVAGWRDYTQGLERACVMAGSSSLVAETLELSQSLGRESKLRRGLEGSGARDEFDYVLIDTPGNLEILTLNALVAADDVIVPTTPDLCSASGVDAVFKAIGGVREECNPAVRVSGVVICNYRSQTRLHRAFDDTLRTLCEAHGARLFKTRVRQSIKASEGLSYGVALGGLNGESGISTGIVADYRDLVGEYLGKGDNMERVA